MWFGTRRVAARDIPAFSPGGIGDKEEFCRSGNIRNHHYNKKQTRRPNNLLFKKIERD